MAVTNNIWQSSDGNWNTAGSWSGGVPLATENAIFDGVTQQAVTTVPTTTNVKLALIHTHAVYGGDLGTSGSPVSIQATVLKHEGSGTLYFDADATVDTNQVIVNSVNTDNAATLGGDAINHIVVISGKVTIKSTLAGDFNLYVVGANAEVVVEAGAGAETASKVFQSAGKCTSNIDWTLGVISGGVFIQETVECEDLVVTGGIANLNFREPDDADDEIEGDLIIVGGTVDLTNNNRGSFSVGSDAVLGGGVLRFHDGEFAAGAQKIVAGTRQEIT